MQHDHFSFSTVCIWILHFNSKTFLNKCRVHPSRPNSPLSYGK